MSDAIMGVDPTVLSVVLGLGLIIPLVLGLIKWHMPIWKTVKKACKAIFSFNGFFWIVNLSCMAYSAQNAGYVFGLYEASGVVVGIALDGLIIVFTQTALAAKARGETRRAAMILLFIVFCCLLSTIGNLAHNLHTDISVQTSHVWFAEIIPYVTSLMPLLLIALAWVADLKINPLEKEDPELYRQNEEKQLRFQQIQIESNEKRTALQTRAIGVEVLRRRNNALRRGKVPGSFRWFWEKAVDPGEMVSGVATQLQALFTPQIEEMKHELEALRNEKVEFIAHAEQVSAERLAQIQQFCYTLISQQIGSIQQDMRDHRLALVKQYDQDISRIESRLTSQIDELLSNVKTAVSGDVITLQNTTEVLVAGLAAAGEQQAETSSRLAQLAALSQSSEQLKEALSAYKSDIDRQLSEVKLHTERSQEDLEQRLSTLAINQAMTAEQMVALSQSSGLLQENLSAALAALKADINDQLSEVKQYTERSQEDIRLHLSTSVNEQVTAALQKLDIPDETMIKACVSSVVNAYTTDQTDDHSMTIDSERPLYPFMTDELKMVVARFPLVLSWVRAGRRTVSVADVVAATNFSHQFVGRQASNGVFARVKTDSIKAKTENIYTTKSVINWLKTDPSPKRKVAKKAEQTTEESEVIPQQEESLTTEEKGLITEQSNGQRHAKTTVNLNDYAELLVPASAVSAEEICTL